MSKMQLMRQQQGSIKAEMPINTKRTKDGKKTTKLAYSMSVFVSTELEYILFT